MWPGVKRDLQVIQWVKLCSLMQSKPTTLTPLYGPDLQSKFYPMLSNVIVDRQFV